MNAALSRRAARVIHEDEHILVVHRPGSSAFTLVTFGGMFQRPSGTRIWAGRPVEALDLDAIGFLAKAPNWYPAVAVGSAAPDVRRVLRHPAVGYGYSMGGYAALKYGRMLGLEAALAAAPQVSIDPGDVPQDMRYRAYFDARLHAGMGVQPEDLCPFPAIVADPHFAPDRRHAELAGPPDAVRRIWLPYLRHGVIEPLTGTAVLRDVLDLMLAGDAAGIRQLLRARRRTSRWWHGMLAATALHHGRVALAEVLWTRAAELGTPAESLARERERAARERDQALRVAWRRPVLRRFVRRLLAAADAGDWQGVRDAAAYLPTTVTMPRVASEVANAAVALGDPRAAEEAAGFAAGMDLLAPARLSISRRLAGNGHGLAGLAALLADPDAVAQANARVQTMRALAVAAGDPGVPVAWRAAARALRRRLDLAMEPGSGHLREGQPPS